MTSTWAQPVGQYKPQVNWSLASTMIKKRRQMYWKAQLRPWIVRKGILCQTDTCYSGNTLFLTGFKYIIHEMLQLLISILHHIDLAVNHFSRSSSDFLIFKINVFFLNLYQKSACTKNACAKIHISYYVQFVNKIHILKYRYFKTFDT